MNTLPSVSYEAINLSDLRISITRDNRGKIKSSEVSTASGSVVNAYTGDRFWNSLNSHIGTSKDSFTHVDPQPVIEKIIEKRGDIPLHLAVERSDIVGITDTALACVSPKRAIITTDEAQNFITELGGLATYNHGVIRATLAPRRFNMPIGIGSESFEPRVGVELPIDGWETPEFAVGLMRLLCENGMVGWDTAFSTPVHIGSESPMEAINRAFNAFSNEKGFDTLTHKVEELQDSFASLDEVSRLITLIQRHVYGMVQQQAILGAIQGRLAAKTLEFLNYALDLSHKSRAGIPTELRTIDLVNIITETTSHNIVDASSIAHKALTSWVSQKLILGADIPGSAKGLPYIAPAYYVKQAA